MHVAVNKDISEMHGVDNLKNNSVSDEFRTRSHTAGGEIMNHGSLATVNVLKTAACCLSVNILVKTLKTSLIFCIY